MKLAFSPWLSLLQSFKQAGVSEKTRGEEEAGGCDPSLKHCSYVIMYPSTFVFARAISSSSSLVCIGRRRVLLLRDCVLFLIDAQGE